MIVGAKTSPVTAAPTTPNEKTSPTFPNIGFLASQFPAPPPIKPPKPNPSVSEPALPKIFEVSILSPVRSELNISDVLSAI